MADEEPTMEAHPRGRSAEKPTEIPKRGWIDIALRVKAEVAEDRASFVSAAVAFYILMGLVPTLGVVVSLYGLVADPSDVTRQVKELGGLVPPDALKLIDTELTRVASSDKAAGIGAIIAILIAIWGGSKAMDALVTAMNIAYGERDRRGFIKSKLVGLGLTLGAAVFIVVAVGLLVVTPIALNFLGLGRFAEGFIAFVRWPILFAIATVAISTLYRFGPDRKDAKWRWVTPGSLVATALWVLASAGLSYYAVNFSDYSASYGSLGAIVLLLLWFYLTGFAIILGAELNSEMELQTAKDTTTGFPKPMGRRGAYVADNLPPKP